jgi:hypothetical protein
MVENQINHGSNFFLNHKRLNIIEKKNQIMNYITHDYKHNIDIYEKKTRKYHGM